MDILSLGSKIKLKRKEKNMKLKDLAGDRITPGQISLIETGKSNPSEDLLKYLAERLDTTVEYLLESEKKQAEDVCFFYDTIVESSLACENFSRAEENIEKGLHYAKEYKIDLYEGIFTYKKAKLEFCREDYNKSQTNALSSLVTFLNMSNDYECIKVFMLLGDIAVKNENYNLAYSYFKEAENSYNKSKTMDRLIRIKIYYNIARCLDKISEHGRAIDYALIVKEEISLVENYNLYADTLMILAMSYAQKNEKEEALKYANEAKKVCTEKNDILCIANIEEGIGDFLISSFSVEEGVDYLKRALDIKTSLIGEKVDKTILKIISGLITYNKHEDALEKIDYFEKEYDVEIESKIKIIEYKYIIYKNLNNIKNAEKQILKLIKVLDLVNNKEELEYYLMLIASFYKDIEEDKLALKYYEKAFELKKMNFN